MTIQDFHAGFRRHFPKLDPRDYLSQVHLRVSIVAIDIFKLDEKLHELHGEYDANDDCSMADLLIREYGAETEAWVRSAL